MHDILARVASGELTPAEAAPLLRADRVARLEDRATVDLDRHHRGGVPEVVLAGPKRAADVVAIVAALLDRTGQACVSRMRAGHRAGLQRLATERGATVIAYGRRSCRVIAEPPAEKRGADAVHGAETDGRVGPNARANRLDAPSAIAAANGHHAPASKAHIGLIAAGTSDLEALAEARMVGDAAGCTTTLVADVGVAGLHRLFEPLSALLAANVDALVVAAGMDGALPSVVAGLVDVPVIGLPTSTGYGAGGKGEAALLSMLQTCAPGLVVVNVDNGVGAGAAAVRIALRRHAPG
jgi:NCAIR mutase (PurE)-related protein